MHLGFDRLQYPGDAVMASLMESTPLGFVAVYLAPAPSQGYTGWMGHVPDLVAANWGIAPVYVGQQTSGGPGSHTLTADQGALDSVDAAKLASTAGLATGSVVYLDIEQGGPMAADLQGYVEAWVKGMSGTDYRAGVYCSFSKTAAQVVSVVGDLPVWAFHPRDGGPSTVDLSTETAPDPGDSGYPGALVWQYRMSLKGAIDLTWTDSNGAAQKLASVDLDSSVVSDPSNPVLPTPTVSSVDPSSAATGDTVTITGTDFIGVTDVSFGSVSAANVTVSSETELSAIVPTGLTGQSVNVAVTNRWGNQSTDSVSVSVDMSGGT